MSTSDADRVAAGSRPARAPSRTRRRRRRLIGALAAAAVVVIVVVASRGPIDHAIRSITLPLRDASIIRQQAAEKHLDPALIAAIIYQESRFEDRTSSTGATGLMQILPSTARAIAKRSGGSAFVPTDLATPQVNISYGSYYLRLLINHYGGNLTLAVAAYNAGQQNVDHWVSRAGGPKRFDPATDIPFAETRAYVRSVSDHRRSYRQSYAKELGYA